MSHERVLTRLVGVDRSWTLDVYRAHGGYEAARKAITSHSPAELIQLVKDSGLRGRGGAGFPTGAKWGFVPSLADRPGPRYVVINADESEPGTFKDRVLIENDPHAIIEATLISAWAVGSHTSFVYIRGEMELGYRRLVAAVREAEDAGLLGDRLFGSDFSHRLVIHRGGGAYICGEETALLSSLEGKRGNPKLKPPFPATHGAFNQPTVVNNVETVCNLPHIINRGVDWFRSFGTQGSPGPKLFCVSGHVRKPGVYEVPMGLSALELIEVAGGIWKQRALKAIFPGGSSTPVLTAEECGVAMDFDSLKEIGSFLGSAATIVLDETTCMVDALWNLMRFYHHESCGQCTPCREGTGWLEGICERLELGLGRESDIALLVDVSRNMLRRTICPLADAAAMPALAVVKKFEAEFVDHQRAGGCPNKLRAGVSP